MRCEGCGAEVAVQGDDREGTMHYEPVEARVRADKGNGVRIPFACQLCGAIDFMLKAVRDVVFLYPIPKTESVASGLIILPDMDFVGGNTQERFTSPIGYILTAGEGCVNAKTGRYDDTKGVLAPGDKVIYHKQVPWEIDLPGQDGRMHRVVYCGFRDIWARVEEPDGIRL